MATKPRWSIYTNKENSYGEIIPNDDDKIHIFGVFCECEPKVKVNEKEGVVVVHRSFDGREAVEWAMEIISNHKEFE